MDNEIKIKFESKAKSLFDLAYVSLDLNQILVFGELLNDQKYDEVEKMYLEKGSFKLTRQNEILRKYSENIKVISIREGSIEIILTGMSILSAAIITYLGIIINRKLAKEDEELIFEVNPKDQYLIEFLEKYEKGDFGKDNKSLNWLIEFLSNKGYSTEIISGNAFRIKKVMDKYEEKIIKIISKY